MSYVHHFSYQPWGHQFRQQWTSMVRDAIRLCQLGRDRGIAVHDHYSPGADYIHVSSLDGGGTLTIDSPIYGTVTPSFATRDCCGTDGEPFDAVVAAILLRCSQLAPDDFVIASDGQWDWQWLQGVSSVGPMHPLGCTRAEPSARRLVIELFGVDAPRDGRTPLHACVEAWPEWAQRARPSGSPEPPEGCW